ncbi:MAG: hypothetical protein M1830_009081 [Pleopsidium flavum]|nr:MAG: hypothetical protein M1830_009081 [Pleopsidium flavum]
MDVRHGFEGVLATLPRVGRRVFQVALDVFNKTVETTARAAINISQSILDFDCEDLENMQTAATDSDELGDGEHGVKKRAYDIPTLLELGGKVTKPCHPSKFTSDAVSANILKSANIATSNNSRARGLSNISNVSMASETEEILFKRNGPKEQNYPSRQPEGPPETPLAQIHAGFRKFLKEHSSPPHNRVTAGGRIVPVLPHASAPPSFNLSSIDDVIQGQAQATAANIPSTADLTCNIQDQTPAGSSPAMKNLAMASAGGGSQADSQRSDASFVTALPITEVSQGPVSFITPHHVPSFPTPLPPGARVLMTMPHGPAIVVVNNMLYEATSEGVNTILAPLQVMKPNAQPASLPMYPAHGAMQPIPMIPMQHMPLMNMTNSVPFSFNQPPADVQRQALERQHEMSRGQLEQLDKYVALHRSELGAQALASIVAQRRQLVVKLDEIRVSKEQLDKGLSFGSHPFGAHGKQGRQELGFNSSFGNIVGGQYVPGIGLPARSEASYFPGASLPSQSGSSIYNVATPGPARYGTDTNGRSAPGNIHGTDAQAWQQNSGYGPHVPAFNNDASVSHFNPAGSQPGIDGRRTHGSNPNPEAQAWQHRVGTAPQSSAFSTAPSSTSFGTSSGPSWDRGSLQQNSLAKPQGRNVSHNEFGNGQPNYVGAHQQSSVLPLVTIQQASYATILGLNLSPGPKKYCSTPAEFAEVIRRAREQAKLYGRYGGSINDPQYDAEQDVRWAMAEHERIPLPKEVPDYFSNPRPWTWPSKTFGDETVGLSFAAGSGGNGWGVPAFSAHGFVHQSKTPEHPRGYAQARQPSMSSQDSSGAAADYGRGRHTYAPKTTAPVYGPPNPLGSQTTWTENGNGNLTRRTNHAYVEDMPETPSRHGSGTRSITAEAAPSQTYTPVALAWELPSLEECKGKGKAKDSWATNSQDDPNLPPLPESQRIRRTVFTYGPTKAPAAGTTEGFDSEELEASSAIASTSNSNNQKDFLRTMLKNPRYSAPGNDFADFQTRVDEELRKAGRNADGTPNSHASLSSSANKENQKSGYHFNPERFRQMMARDKGPTYNATHPNGPQDTRIHKGQSSVASPLYQARGQLPQYDGAADSLSTGAAASSDRASDQANHAKAKAGSAVVVPTVPPFLYEPSRRFPVSERLHQQAINGFFKSVRDEEREEIAKYQAQFPLM